MPVMTLWRAGDGHAWNLDGSLKSWLGSTFFASFGRRRRRIFGRTELFLLSGLDRYALRPQPSRFAA
jgi:hypothetical protein